MNREEIMKILPHRDSMLLLDEAELVEPGVARGKLKIRGDEWFLNGHFPGNPVVPGVILCEIIGQCSCALFKGSIAGKTPYYAGIEKARFRRMVRPGDTVEIRATELRSKLNVHVISGEATVDGQLACSGEFSFVIA